MTTPHKPRLLPSSRWSSLDGWDYNGMKERLQAAVAQIDKPALLAHAERIKQQKLSISKPFSAGQYWVCFEMVAEDASLVIARVRLPRHPSSRMVSEDDEAYAIRCEVATMRYVKQRLPSIAVPSVYAYEAPGSPLATKAGAAYMLLEGFYGNTLTDVEFNICSLPATVQQHITTQWTRVQAELATLAHPRIGSISSLSSSGEPVIGKLATAALEGFKNPGPFATAAEYFAAVAEAAIRKSNSEADGNSTPFSRIGALVFKNPGPFATAAEYFAAVAEAAIRKSNSEADGNSTPFSRIGALVFCDIVSRTALFKDAGTKSLFPLHHMDLGTQNILVDDDFTFLAIIDWEFTQTAPRQINYYPMPFPLLKSDRAIQDILADPSHCAYRNISQQEFTRGLYRQGFQSAEQDLEGQGRSLTASFADVLDGPASRIYACFTKLGLSPQGDDDLVYQMVQLAFGWAASEAEEYISKVERLRSSTATRNGERYGKENIPATNAA